jgi:tRNA (guanine-N7-)-methyltransferase
VRNKLTRFAENEERYNIIQPGKPSFETIGGNWNNHFGNNNPITLELGCGRGEYTIGLARQYPNRNYIGIDIKGARIFYGSRIAEDEGLANVAFLRIKILEIDKYFADSEVDEIWMTFPDPRPKDRDEKRRMTHPRYFNLYQQIIKDGGWFHLKTDATPFFDFALESLKEIPHSDLVYTHDLYAHTLLEEHGGLQTRYEKKFLEEGKKINYLRCRLHKSN